LHVECLLQRRHGHIHRRIELHFHRLLERLVVHRELHFVTARQHLWTTRPTKERELFLSRRTPHFRPTKPQVPRDAIQSLFTRRTLDVLHELAGAIEDLKLDRGFLVELVFQVVSYQCSCRWVWSGKLLVAGAVTRKATRVS